MMRNTALFVLILVFDMAVGETLPPPGVPPIDSEDEAIFVASKDFFMLQSCVSYEFKTTVEEFETYWSVTSKDIDPVGDRPCRTVTVAVCKSNGNLEFDQLNISCGD